MDAAPHPAALAAAMRAHAEAAVVEARERFGVTLDYSEATIPDLEVLLARYARAVPKGAARIFTRRPESADVARVVLTMGAYLGEVMCRNLGGEWADGTPPGGRPVALVRLPGGVEVSPPAKVHQRITVGAEHDVRFFYDVVRARVTGAGQG